MVQRDALARSVGDLANEPAFEVLGSLAAGRSSMLFLGRNHASPAKLVVIKRPHPGFAGESNALSEFAREASLAAAVEDDHVVGVHVIGSDAAGPYFVMDFVEGVSLFRLQTVDRDGRTLMTPLPTAVASRIALDVLAGLHAVHESRSVHVPGGSIGLVHGDVSPGNILVGVAGTCRLIDFGSASAAGALPIAATLGATPRPGYSAPERILGEVSSRASDIFAAGVVLWELFAGRRLFSAPTPQMVARQILGGYIPDLASVAPAVPRAIAAVCERALRRAPDARFVSAEQFRAELSYAVSLSFGQTRHEAVAVFVRARCAAIIAQVRGMFEGHGPAARSGLRPRVPQP